MKVLVTGGGGFLGRRIVELLLERGDDVTFLARSHYPEVEALGARGLQVDLCDAEAVASAVHGQEAVIHVAGKIEPWGDLAEFRKANVDGTRHVLDACEQHEVGKLVYTSTPSVVGYAHDLENAPQDTPYAEEHWSPYPQTKAEAERMVLQANSEMLATVALRPHLVFGPRDKNLLTRVVERAHAGKLPIVGDGQNTVDLTYVDNAAWAHLDALDKLTSHQAPHAGKAYFISNGEPVVLWSWLNEELLEPLGVNPVRRKIPFGVAFRLGHVIEWAWDHLPLKGEPRMTRSLAAGLAGTHWYDMTPAKRDFDYRVRVSMKDGIAATIDDFKARGIPS